MRSRGLSLLVCLLVTQAIGCGHEARYHWVKTKRYSPNQTELNLITTSSGRYLVAKREHGSEDPIALDETTTHLATGKPFGFRRDERGHTIAYADRREYDLGMVSPSVKYLRWIHREYQPAIAPVIDVNLFGDEVWDLVDSDLERHLKNQR